MPKTFVPILNEFPDKISRSQEQDGHTDDPENIMPQAMAIFNPLPLRLVTVRAFQTRPHVLLSIFKFKIILMTSPGLF